MYGSILYFAFAHHDHLRLRQTLLNHQSTERSTMEKFIPYEKLSKKKRELDAKRRGTWAIDPTVRRPANPKAYNRRTAQKWRNDDPFLCRFLFCLAFSRHLWHN